MIRKMLMVTERRFRRLKAPRLMMDVYPGAQYADGLRVGRLILVTRELTQIQNVNHIAQPAGTSLPWSV